MDALLDRVRRLGAGRRLLLGICGAPGAGKSTLARRLAEAVGAEAVVVPMDGFHLDDDELRRLGRLDRKGAPDTFDVDGYRTLLARLRADDGTVVYAPAFDRDRELSLAGAIPVLPEHRVVVTEGNYLLLDVPGWRGVHDLLDECWFLTGDDAERVRRLEDRHVAHGRTRTAAQAWVRETDEPNARLVASTAGLADLVVDLADLPAWMAP